MNYHQQEAALIIDAMLPTRMSALLRLYAKRLDDLTAPVEMLLFCPRCHVQHIDKIGPGWSNPPHATHTCGHCGLLWRPSNRNTTGVGTVPALEPKHVERIRASYVHVPVAGVEIPLCALHAESWFCDRNHLKGNHDCVACAHLGVRR